MSAVLFWKKRIYLIVTGILSTVFVCAFILYAYFLIGIETVSLNKSFYFLVSENTHVEASTHIIEQNGGAGYLLEAGEREYVVFSVYLKESDGQAVLSKVGALEENVSIVEQRIGKLYFKTRSEKEKKEQITGVFRSLYGCIEVLDKEIARLSNGATQESSKRVLGVLYKQLNYIAIETKAVFPQMSELCKNVAQKLFSFTQDIVYVKDLRYLQCEMCNKYVKLGETFAL